MNRIKKKIVEFYKIAREFDTRTSYRYIKNRHTLGHDQFSLYVQEFLESYFEPVIHYYEDGNSDYYSNIVHRSIEGNVIWVCWWQGEDHMPDVVKMCYLQLRSLCEKLEGVTLVLISKDNYSEYVDIPDFIIDKLNRGVINLTAFSDVLRQCLLSASGGAWIDSTVFCTSVEGIEKLFQTPFFSIKINNEHINRASEGQVVTGGKWAGFFLNNIGINVFSFVRDCLLYYWERQDYLINFYIQNYCLKIAYNRFQTIKNTIDSQDLFCDHVYYIEECFKRGDSPAVLDDTKFYKLSYKIFSEEYIAELKDYLKRNGIIDFDF